MEELALNSLDLDQATHNAMARVRKHIQRATERHQQQLRNEAAWIRGRMHSRHFAMRRDLGLTAFIPSHKD